MSTKRILLVDDDPLVLRLYREGLSHYGAEIATASDGMAAVQALHATKPDVVILDLMMPRFSGVDVLKFIRSEAKLKQLPVVVLSNSYMNELAADAAALGVQKALLKVRCTPALLMRIIDDVLMGRAETEQAAPLLAVPERKPTPPPTPAPPSHVKPASPAPAPPPNSPAPLPVDARRSFLDGAKDTCTALRSLYQYFSNAANPTEREPRLQNLYRKVHFVAATAALAECRPLAQMTSALEALLFELFDKPAGASPSVLRTIAATIDFIPLLFDCARDADFDVPPLPQAMVVDDDPLNNRLVVAALRRAHLEARSTDDAMVGLQWLKEQRFDLVLLDIEMPGMNGFELCRRLRSLPGYQHTPVIYVTGHNDFETRTKSVLSGGDDLISKPVFPMDLAVKATALLLKRQMKASQPKNPST
jgi:CheY-like chemotaxis protein